MPKYYVISNDWNVVLDCEDEEVAACLGVCSIVENEKDDVELGEFIRVSEIGIKNVYPDDMIFHTKWLIDRLELTDYFSEDSNIALPPE